MLTPSVKALFKHSIKIPIKYSECAGKLGAPVGIDSCHGQKGRLARRSHVLASEVVGLCNTGLWPHPPTCPLSFARRQPSSRPCKAKTRRFDSRFRNRARDCAERALGGNDSKVAATPVTRGVSTAHAGCGRVQAPSLHLRGRPIWNWSGLLWLIRSDSGADAVDTGVASKRFGIGNGIGIGSFASGLHWVRK